MRLAQKVTPLSFVPLHLSTMWKYCSTHLLGTPSIDIKPVSAFILEFLVIASRITSNKFLLCINCPVTFHYSARMVCDPSKNPGRMAFSLKVWKNWVGEKKRWCSQIHFTNTDSTQQPWCERQICKQWESQPLRSFLGILSAASSENPAHVCTGKGTQSGREATDEQIRPAIG